MFFSLFIQMPDSPNQYDSPFPPPPPPVRPNVAEYVKAFNKPLTTDEKAAWLAEIVYRVLHGELQQEVYPALKDHIEALPLVTASKDRPEEKLPGSDYVYPGPPKPLKPLTTVFPDAEPMHVFEQKPIARTRQKSDSSFGVLLFVFGVFILVGIAYGIGSWMMNKTKVNNPAGAPIEQVAAVIPTESVSVAADTSKPDNPLENPFEDPDLAKDIGSGFTPEMLAKLKHREELPIIRMTLEIDENDQGRFRAERGKSSDNPPNLLPWTQFKHSLFSQALAYRGEKGMGRIIWGFNDPREAWNDFHGSWGKLNNVDMISDNSILGFGGFGINIFTGRKPIRLCADFHDTGKGRFAVFLGGGVGEKGKDQKYNRVWFFVTCHEDGTFFTHLTSDLGDVRYDLKDSSAGKLGDTNLAEPIEGTFRLNGSLFGIDVGASVFDVTDRGRIMRFDMTSRFDGWTGLAFKEQDGNLLVDNVGEKTSARRVGLQVGDIIKRINGKQYTEAEAKELLKDSPFGTEYVLDINRNGERKTYTVHTE